jgi:hypothetical protein
MSVLVCTDFKHFCWENKKLRVYSFDHMKHLLRKYPILTFFPFHCTSTRAHFIARMMSIRYSNFLELICAQPCPLCGTSIVRKSSEVPLSSGENRTSGSVCFLNEFFKNVFTLLVKTLCCKPEGRGFETVWGEWISSVYLILPAALGPGVYSASNRNEHQKQANNVPGRKTRPVRWADSLATICEPIV